MIDCATVTSRGPRTAWCRTCEARDRAVLNGTCVVCGNAPTSEPSVAPTRYSHPRNTIPTTKGN